MINFAIKRFVKIGRGYPFTPQIFPQIKKVNCGKLTASGVDFSEIQ